MVLATRRVRDSGWRNQLRRVPSDSTVYTPMLKGGDSKVKNYANVDTGGAITGAIWKRLPSGLWYLDYDGIDDRTLWAQNDITNIPGALSVSIWVKLDVAIASQPDTVVTLVSKQATSQTNRNFALRITKATDVLDFNGRNAAGDGYIFESAVAAVGATYLDDLIWHKITGVWNRANTTSLIFIDAVARSTDAGQTDADLYTAANGYMDIANSRGQADTFLDGGATLLDLQAKALSAEEEADYYGWQRQIVGV